ncbi:MAG TPA: STAS domain-containing protein [Candidatus Angelobacter sp.]|jgi:anti-sigma B factor antagonist
MTDSLEIEQLRGDLPGQGVLCLHGPLTAENLIPFQHAIRRENSATVVLDFTEVPYVDSAGLGSLVSAYISRHKAGHRMALSGVCPRVMKLLEITHTDALFLIFETVEDAMDALSHAASA